MERYCLELRRYRDGHAWRHGNPSEGSVQPASGARAVAVPASAPARILAENSVRSICYPSRWAGDTREVL